MRYYIVQYLPTGRLVLNRDNTPLILTGNSEQGAKAKYTRAGHYLDWNLHALREAKVQYRMTED